MKQVKKSTDFNWKPALYATIYPTLRDIAIEHGYALAIHGSLSRDFDLVAIAWTENPKPHLEMIAAFQNYLGLFYSGEEMEKRSEKKHHGRIAYVIGTGSSGYIDLSIISPC